MKGIAVLLLLALAGVSQALPSFPEGSRRINGNREVHRPVVLRSEAPPSPKALHDVTEEVRVRRSPRDEGRRGSVDVEVRREPGRGTVAKAEGTGTIWSSNDGRARVEGYGQWSKGLDGPGSRKPNYEGGVRFTYDM